MNTTEPDPFAARLVRFSGGLAESGRRVAAYIGQNRAAALGSSAAELAAATGTSDATVIRTVQALGYGGIAEMKRDLVRGLEQGSTAADDMRRTLAELGAGTAQALDLVLEAHGEALRVLRSATFRQQMAASVRLLYPAARIAVFGIGPSAALARYASVLLARAGRASRPLDATGIMLADQFLDLRGGDAILALAYGRAYREVTALFGEAKRLGLPIVLVSEGDGSALARDAGSVLVVPRGRSGRIALHGGTLVALEALVLALAASDGAAAVAQLDRLNRLRTAIGGVRQDIG